MPFRDYKCPKCSKVYEIFCRSMTENPAVKCKKCGLDCEKQLSTGVMGMNANAEPWEYDYVKKVKPKYVKDHHGHRHKYNSQTHLPGRKGSGR